jgi:hypothetical protein
MCGPGEALPLTCRATAPGGPLTIRRAARYHGLKMGILEEVFGV